MRKLQKKWWFPKISLPPVDKSGRVWFPFFVWHWGLPEDIAVLMLTMRKCADLFVSNLLIWSRRTTRWERRRHSSLRQRQEAAAKAAAARGWVIREDDPDASAWLAYCCPKLVAHRTPKQISPSNMTPNWKVLGGVNNVCSTHVRIIRPNRIQTQTGPSVKACLSKLRFSKNDQTGCWMPKSLWTSLHVTYRSLWPRWRVYLQRSCLI